MERHYVTVVFSDLSDSTRFAHTEDPETVAQAISQIRALANNLAARHRGIVNQHYGDGILTLFGLPRSGEDDAVRALGYALDLHAESQSILVDAAPSFRIGLHSGVDGGLVAVNKGDLTSGVYEAFGDALNRAARLSDHASSSEILVNVDTLRLAADFFRTSPASLVDLKGIDEPIQAALILGRSATDERFAASARRGLTTFTGRHTEMRTLSASIKESGSRLRIITLLGEAGIGKSRFVSEILKKFSELVTLKGVCTSQLGASPLEPFMDCLRRQVPGGLAGKPLYEALDAYLETIDTSLTGRTPVLHAALHSPSELNAQRVSSALRAWLVALARKSRSVVFIDDWQWADDASRELLSRLVVGNPDIVLLLAARSLNAGDPGLSGDTIGLGPLSESESETAVVELLGTITRPGLMQVIQERAGGNPLYIEELCQSARARSAHSTWSPEFHPTLASLIEAKITDLSEKARKTAYLCAVLGDRIPTPMIFNILGDIESVPELSDADILFATSVASIRFKHGLTREVIYSVIPRELARKLHTQVAEVLRAQARDQGIEEPIEELARHYKEAGHLELCLHYSSLAGDRALAANTLDRSRHHYHNAVDSLRKMANSEDLALAWLNVSSRLALACTYAPSHEVIEILHDAAEVVRDDIDRAQLDYYRSWIYYALSDQNKALRYSRNALTVAQGMQGSEKLQAQLYACIGQSAAANCDYPLAREYLGKAVTAKKIRGKGKSPPIGWAYALTCLGLVNADEGNFDRAYELMDEALASVAGANQSIEAAVSNIYNVVRAWRGRWDDVIEHAPNVCALAERYSLPYIFLVSRISESYARWMRDQDAAALDVLRIATQQVIDSEMQLYLSIFCGWAADASSLAGLYREAEDFAASGLQAAEHGDPTGAPMIYRALHACATREELGLTPEASRYLERAYAAARLRNSRVELVLTQFYEARFLHALGDIDEAKKLASQVYMEASSMGMDSYAHQARELTTLLA